MNLPVRTELEGFVTHVEAETGTHFLKVWIQFDSNLSALIESTLDNLKESLNNDKGRIQVDNIKVGDMYLALYSEDNNWYRARITDISLLSKGSVLVSFVDYGNCESVDINVIRQLNDIIANYPDQAQMCILDDVYPADVNWSADALKYCKDNLCYEEVKVMITTKTNVFPVVRITSRKKQISFNEEIILAGYARGCAGISNGNNAHKHASEIVNNVEKISRNDALNFTSSNASSHEPTEVVVVHVISATKVWVHFIRDRQLHNWDAMKSGIESYCHNVPQKPFERVAVGLPCIAQNIEKKCYARGLITEKDAKACHVFFIDYGNIEQKLPTNLYPIPQAYRTVPQLAQQCSVDFSSWNGDPRHITEHLRSLEGATPVKCFILGMTKMGYQIQLISDENLKESGVPRFQRVAIEPGQSYVVEVTHIRRPTSFYVQKVDSKASYQILFAELQNENKKATPLNQSVLYPGMPCCVFNNDRWYRGEVIQVPIPGVVSVFFVDIGQKEVVTTGNVTAISPELVQRLPAQALECSLQGFEGCNQRSVISAKEMTAMMSQRQLTMEVLEVKNDIARVNMYDLHKGGVRLLNLELSVRIEESQKKIVIPFPEVDTIETVFITHFESLNSFFGQCVKFSTESLDQLQYQLNQFYCGMNSGECNLYADGQSHMGDYCCAPYSSDHQFYRAKVLSKTAEEVTVLFVDFGNKEIVPACDVKILKSQFAQLPQFGIVCCYDDSLSVNMASQVFSSVLVNQTVTLEVIRREDSVFRVKISPLHNDSELLKKLTFLKQASDSHPPSSSYNESDLHYIDVTLEGNEEEITVVHFKSPLKFWCQLNRMTTDLTLVTSLIADYAQSSSCLVFNSVPPVRTPCLAKYSADQSWYRGSIMTAPNEKSMVKVYFEDFGNSDMVHLNDLRQTSQTLMTLPRLAIECSIANIRVGEFPFEVLHSLEEQILDKSFKVRILNSQPTYKLEFIDEIGRAILEKSGICFRDVKSQPPSQSFSAAEVEAAPDDIMDNDTGWDEECSSFHEGLQSVAPSQPESSTWPTYQRQNENFDNSNFGKENGRPFRNRDTYGARRHNSSDNERGRKRGRWSGSDESDRSNAYQGRSYNDDGYQKGNRFQDRNKNNGPYKRFLPPRMQKTKPNYQNSAGDVAEFSSAPVKTECDWDNPSADWDSPAADWNGPCEKSNFGASGINKIIDIPILSLESGVYKEVSVVHVCTPSEFYCHLVDSIPTFEKSLSDLQIYYSNVSESELKISNPHVGMVCCAKFSEDGEWYRAKIKSLNGDTLEVFFLDYGNVDNLNISQVKVLKSEYHTLNAQALKCSLNSALPVNYLWSKEDIDFFESQTLGKEVLCKFVGKKEDDNTAYTVKLMDISLCDDVMVDYAMIKEGHARPINLNDGVYRSLVNNPATSPFPENAVECGTSEDVIVSWLDSPDRFFCQLQRNDSQLNWLEEGINSFYSSCKPQDFMLNDPQPYAACVASYGNESCEAWYRASILALDDKDAVVLFVDYGNVETVSRQKVLDIKAEYRNIPVQAFKCRLRNVKPIGFKWPKFNKKLLEQYFGGTLKCTFQSKDDNGFLSVDLESDTVNVAQRLVNDKLASDNKRSTWLCPELKKEYDISSKDGDVLESPKDSVQVSDSIQVKNLSSYGVSPGQQLDVVCTCIVSPYQLFVQKISDASIVDELSEKLNTAYNSDEFDFETSNFEIGDRCVAQFSADEKWYRAVVLEKLDGKYDVRFIDFGNKEVVESDKLRKTTTSFDEIPPLAAECSLFGLEAVPPEVTQDSLYDTLNNILQFGELTILAEFLYVNKDGKFMVKLSVDNKDVASELGTILGFPVHSGLNNSLIVDEIVDAYTAHVESLSNFWLQRAEDSDEIQSLQQKIATYCSTITCDPNYNPGLGDLCLARFSEDSSWYRAQTCSPWDASGVTVRFVDFGNSEVVSVQDLLQIPGELSNIPIMAFHSALHGISNVDEEWAQDRIAHFKELVGHGEYLLKVRTVSKDVEKYYVTLNYNDVDIMEQLMTNGLQIMEDKPSIHETPSNHPEVVKFTVGESLEVMLSYADSPSNFWVQRSTDESTIQELQGKIGDHCIQCADNDNMETDEFVVGYFCLAQFSDDEQWYRAQIVSVNDDGTVHVQFVDFGNSETIPKNRLMTIPDKFAKFPFFAVNCTLNGFQNLPIAPCSPETLIRFNELTGHGEFILNAEVLEYCGSKFCLNLHHNEIDISQAMIADSTEKNVTTTNAVNHFEEFVISLGEKLEVFISHVESPSQFWVQLVTRQAALKELVECVNSLDLNVDVADTGDQFEIGDYCMTRNGVDERLYRSLILDINKETESATVSFIDFGSHKNVSFDDIRKIKPQLLSIPPFAHQCRLSGSQVPESGVCDEKFIKAFVESVNDSARMYLAEFIQRENETYVIRLLKDGVEVTESLRVIEGVRGCDGLLDSSNVKLEGYMDDDVEASSETSTPKEILMTDEISDADLVTYKNSFDQIDMNKTSASMESLEKESADECHRMLESSLSPDSEDESFKDPHCNDVPEPDFTRNEEAITVDTNKYYGSSCLDQQPEVSLDVTDGAEPLDVTDGAEPLDITDGAEPLDVTDGAEPLDVTDGAEPLDVTDGAEPLDATDGTELFDGVQQGEHGVTTLPLHRTSSGSIENQEELSGSLEDAALDLSEIRTSEEKSVAMESSVTEEDTTRNVLNDSDEAMVISPHPSTPDNESGCSEIDVSGSTSEL